MNLAYFADLDAALLQRVTGADYKTKVSASNEGVITYFRAARRFIPAAPRQTHFAKSFQCPPEAQAGFAALQQKFSTGASVRMHQSTNFRKADYRDALLNDWDIHHFHLGETTRADGWIERTNLLLLARVTASDAYFIDVRPHGVWSQQSLLTTLHDNWPASLEHARIKGALGLSHNISDADIAVLRKKNINAMIEMTDGTIYAQPGGGSASDGTSTYAVLESNKLSRKCRELEKITIEQLNNELGAAVRAARGGQAFTDADIDFRLDIDAQDTLRAVEQSTGVAALFGSYPLPPIM